VVLNFGQGVVWGRTIKEGGHKQSATAEEVVGYEVGEILWGMVGE
jgi:hypothetical protein